MISRGLRDWYFWSRSRSRTKQGSQSRTRFEFSITITITITITNFLWSNSRTRSRSRIFCDQIHDPDHEFYIVLGAKKFFFIIRWCHLSDIFHWIQSKWIESTIKVPCSLLFILASTRILWKYKTTLIYLHF